MTSEKEVLEQEHHIVSPRIYVAILCALLFATGLTVWASYIDLGEWLTGSYRVTERDDPDSLPLEMQDKKIRH